MKYNFRRSGMERTNLCSTLIQKDREPVMKYNLYVGTEEGKQLCSIVVEEGKWNRQSHVVLLYRGTEERKQ